MANERLLDVSELEPPQPLELVLEAIEELQAGEYLRVLHRRYPNLLFPMLRERGFEWLTRPGIETALEILIWREDDTQAASAAQALAE